MSSSSSKVSHLATALRECQLQSSISSQISNPASPDPIGTNTVYVKEPCKSEATSAADGITSAGDPASTSALQAVQVELEKAQKLLKRKEELLRVRSNQLVEAHELLEDRQALWNASTQRMLGSVEQEPELLAVLAVVGDYEHGWLRDQLREVWYPGGDPKALEDLLGVRVVFVLGANPFIVSDGTGITSDTEAVQQETQKWGDILRVPAPHISGSDGRATLVHHLWRALPLHSDARFYIKAQMNAVPNPRGIAAVLQEQPRGVPLYLGCMKSGQVITDSKSPWYEPASWKFGGGGGGADDRHYMLHASANGYAISRDTALHIAKFSDVLAEYSNEDVMVGAWMLGLNVEHTYSNLFCCPEKPACALNERLSDAAAAALTAVDAAGGTGELAGGTTGEVAGGTGELAGKETLQSVDGAGGVGGQRRDLRRIREEGGDKVCAIFGGGCNGVCGMGCGGACEQDKLWEEYRACARVV